MVFCELHDKAQANLQDDDRDVANETSLPYQTVGKNSEGETSSWPPTEHRHMKSLLKLEARSAVPGPNSWPPESWSN